MPKLHVSLFKYQCTLRAWVIVITTLLLALFIALGFWQLHRAAMKQTILENYKARPKATPLTLADLQTFQQDMKYYPIILKGHYDNAHSFLLDNKIHQHLSGYEILTPFIPDKSDRIILINRGWIARNFYQRKLPEIPDAPIGEITLQGLIDFPAPKPFLLGHESVPSTWPWLIEAIEFPIIQSAFKQTFYPFVVLLSPQEKGGFVRQWQPIFLSPQKSIGYAIQWFSMAGALFVIVLAVNTRRKVCDDKRVNS